MARARVVVGMALAGTLAVACNLLTGVGELEAVVDGADAPPSDEAGVDAGASDAENLTDTKPAVETGPPPRCPSAGNRCAPVAPPDWEGPFLVYEGSLEDDPPRCPDALPENGDFFSGTPGGSFSCECRCGSPAGGACRATLLGYGGGDCAGVATELDLATCQHPSADGSFKVSTTLVAAPTGCQAFGAFRSKQPARFPNALRLCGRPTPFAADGCAANELCVPEGIAPFKPQTCIASGASASGCPAPWTVHLRGYEDDDDIVDRRECRTGTCTCGAPVNVSCTGRMRHYTASNSCTTNTPSTVFDMPLTTCVPAGPSSSQVQTALGVQGTCAASGAPVQQGSVEGRGGIDVCCLP